MIKELQSLAAALVHVPIVVLLAWLVCHPFRESRSTPGALAFPFRAFRVVALVGLAAMLAGCANTDPLAVASGPVFQLNPGHWQPSKQALAAPPTIVAD